MRTALTRILALAGPLLAVSAAAQETPRLFPTRDVAVRYTASAPGQTAQPVEAAWLAARQRWRIETPRAPGWVLLDVPAQRAQMVMEGQRMVVTLPGRGQIPLLDGLPEGAKVSRAGSARVAGHDCALWRIVSKEGNGTACLTPDGVLLRASGEREGRRGSLEAEEVRYAPLNAARFEVPPGLMALNLPQGLSGLGQALPGLLPGGR